MTELKERFTLADGIGSPDLWGEAKRRAAAPEAPPRAIEWPPGAGRRLAAAGVALVVFATAAVFAWDLSHPDVVPSPPPSAADRTVDLATQLPEGWSELPAPLEVRSGAATAWTGSQLLVWGGYEWVGAGDEDPDATGFAFDAASRSWAALPASPLRGRSDAAFAWTGRELLVWGGWDGGLRADPYFGDGAAFDPASRTWRMLPPAPIEARTAFSVWTGREFLVWGSTDRSHRRRDGAAYDPSTDTWRPIADGPVDITDGSAAWTGEEMIVFGAALDGNNHADTPTAIAAAYDPEADAWRELPPSDLSPQAMTAEWLDGELIAWDYEHATAAYSPATNQWRSLADVPLEFSECSPVSVATPRMVFGEFCGETVVFSPEEDAWHRVPMPRPDPPGGCCSVLEPVAAGDVVLVPSHDYGDALDAIDRRMFVYNPTPVVRTDARGEVLEPEPFIPPAERDGDDIRLPVVFPDGSRAVLSFPNELGLDELGIQPDVSYVWKQNPPPRYPIVFLHDPDASIATYVEGTEPITMIEGGGEIWAMSEKWELHRNQLQGVWIRLRVDSWTVLVASTTVADAISVADYLNVGVTQSGFPVVDAVGPLALAEGFGEAAGATLTLGDANPDPDSVSQLDATLFLSPDGCTDLANADFSGGYGSICLGDGNVFASIYGDRDFVTSVIEGVRVEDFRQA
jgi:hypothetical protein